MEEFKITEDGWYVTHGEVIVYLVNIEDDEDDAYPYGVYVFDNPDPESVPDLTEGWDYTVTEYGRVFDDCVDDPDNIRSKFVPVIAPKTELDFQVGKSYLTREGEIVRVVDIDGDISEDTYPILIEFANGNEVYYTVNGQYYEGETSHRDIVSEYTEVVPKQFSEYVKADLNTVPVDIKSDTQEKPSNPKDSIGIRKVPMSVVPANVLAEIGVALAEGALKYARHNYRKVGVRGSVYYDATMRHLMSWWEGESIDEDSGMSHVTKAITSLIVLRDSMMQENWVDDRPPKSKPFYPELNQKMSALLDKYKDTNVEHITELNVRT